MPITIAADAAAFGLSAFIPHQFPEAAKWAIMHATHTLTPSEKYSQIRKESSPLSLQCAVSTSACMVEDLFF